MHPPSLSPQVYQLEVQEERELIATNGKMLHLLTRSDMGAVYQSLREMDTEGMSIWRRVLEHAAQERADALIDAGGLLAGVSNRKAAEVLLEILDSSR